MNTQDFEAKLEEAGYTEIATRKLEPRPANNEHAHDYSVRGLVNDGEFIIGQNGVPHSFTVGQIFEVAAGQLHSEAVGPQGACITTGRMYQGR
jgi:hypothetical protein